MQIHELTNRQATLACLIRDTAERHMQAHGVWPEWVLVSEGWMEEWCQEMGCGLSTAQVLVVAGVPVMVHTMLEGVSVMTRMRG